jgi:hypothetical protein
MCIGLLPPGVNPIAVHIYWVIQEEAAILWEMIVCVILSKKSLYEHGSDFERLRSYDRLKLRIEGTDYLQ